MSEALWTSLPGVDLERLLAPISDKQPSGVDLRLLPHSVLVEIENQLDGKTVPVTLFVDREGNPTGVRDQMALSRSIADGLKRALSCLAEESKDLEIAALCVRGLLAVHGYPGLACGLRLLRELHTRYADTLYPNPPPKVETLDDYGEPLAQPLVEPQAQHERRVLAARSTALEKADHAIRGLLRLTPLFEGTDGRPCRIADWQSASTGDEDARSQEELNKAAASQDKGDLVDLCSALSACVDETQALQSITRTLYARPELPEQGLPELEPPSLKPLLTELRSCLSFVDSLRPQTPPSRAPIRPASSGGTAAATTSAAPAAAPAPQPVTQATGRYAPKDRAEALSLMLAAGQFLQRHEPLSPLPRLLFRLVLWARGDSLRRFLDDMFRTSDAEQDNVYFSLALDETETKLSTERLPGSCPYPRDRADALSMLADVAFFLQSYEPLSPLPYRLAQLLVLATDGSPRLWLQQVFPASSPSLQRICALLGLTPDSHESHASPTAE